jgi:hypothetical protein
MKARLRRPGAPKRASAPYERLVHLYETEGIENRYDVSMQGLDRLQRYHTVECDIVVYPYNRTICSDDIHFNPFEEYVQDVLSRQRSAYSEIPSATDQLFGLLLGLLIALVFAIVHPASLFQIEALVSVIGTYAIAKELWNDLERLLIQATKNGRLRYQEAYYRYQLEKRTTLTSYSLLAKRRRYGMQALLPAKIDFIKQSNSQTLRMCFDARDLVASKDDPAHLLSIQIEGSKGDAFRGAPGHGEYMFGVKLCFARRFLGVQQQFEVFQSMDQGRKGCLDDQDDAWHPDAAFCRRTYSLGRVKFYARKGLLSNVVLIDTDPPAG